jgi:hypothetical protein
VRMFLQVIPEAAHSAAIRNPEVVGARFRVHASRAPE